MARLPRLCVPGQLHHVFQRGANRQPVFLEAADNELMLTLLSEYAAREKVALHAYVLMPDHLHLLLTPGTQTGLPRLMQAIGRRYVQAFNRRHCRSGTLWDSRYKTTVLQAERYLLPCMAYIDLNPVRAGLSARPGDYRWSSHAHYIGLRHERQLTPHALVWQLGNTPFAREAAYAERVQQGLAADEQQHLTDAALKGWALGDPEFLAGLQERTLRRLSRGKAGRPPKSSSAQGA